MARKQVFINDGLFNETEAISARSDHFVYQHNKLHHKLAQLFAHFFTQFLFIGRVNWYRKLAGTLKPFIGEHPDLITPNDSRFKWMACDKTSEQLDRWPFLVLVFIVYMTFKYLASVYFETMKFHYINKISNLTSSGPDAEVSVVEVADGTHSQELDEARRYLDATNQWLVLIGSPFKNNGAFVAMSHLIMIFFTVSSYLFPPIYCNLMKPQRFPLLEMIMNNRKTNEEQSERLIEEQFVYVINSSCNSVQLKGQRIEESATHLWSQSCSTRRSAPKLRTESRTGQRDLRKRSQYFPAMVVAYAEHCRLLEQLALLRASGELVPMNRRQEWVDKVLIYFDNVMLSLLAYSYLLMFFMSYIVFRFFGLRPELNASDFLIIIETYALFHIGALVNVFGLVYINSNCSDQTEYVVRIGQEIESCIRLNESYLWAFLWDRRRIMYTSDRFRSEKLIDLHAAHLNARLLQILLKYRIFISQLAPVLDPWPLLIYGGFGTTVVLPSIMRIYSPYIESFGKIYVMGISMSFMLSLDVILLPICKFHLKGQHLYKKLCSLLAHSVHLDELATRELGDNIYAENSVALLRKDLNHPNGVTDKFTIGALGLKATFSNLFRANFYYGILIISLFSDIESWNLLVGERLRDPLRIL